MKWYFGQMSSVSVYILLFNFIFTKHFNVDIAYLSVHLNNEFFTEIFFYYKIQGLLFSAISVVVHLCCS